MPKRNTQAEVPAIAEPKKPRAAKPRTTAAHKHAAKKSEPIAETSAQPFVSAETREEQIRILAYSYYAARGYQGGSAEEDWFRAEREFAQ